MNPNYGNWATPPPPKPRAVKAKMTVFFSDASPPLYLPVVVFTDFDESVLKAQEESGKVFVIPLSSIKYFEYQIMEVQ